MEETRGKHWVTEPDQEIEIVVGDKGYAAEPPVTLLQVFANTVKKFGNEKALALKRPVNVSQSFPPSFISMIVTDLELLESLMIGKGAVGLEVLDVE